MQIPTCEKNLRKISSITASEVRRRQVRELKMALKGPQGAQQDRNSARIRFIRYRHQNDVTQNSVLSNPAFPGSWANAPPKVFSYWFVIEVVKCFILFLHAILCKITPPYSSQWGTLTGQQASNQVQPFIQRRRKRSVKRQRRINKIQHLHSIL